MSHDFDEEAMREKVRALVAAEEQYADCCTKHECLGCALDALEDRLAVLERRVAGQGNQP